MDVLLIAARFIMLIAVALFAAYLASIQARAFIKGHEEKYHNQKTISYKVDEKDLQERIRLLEDRLNGIQIEANGNNQRLFKYIEHRLKTLEREIEALKIKESVNQKLRDEYIDNCKKFYGRGESKNL